MAHFCPVCGKIHADTAACVETTVTRVTYSFPFENDQLLDHYIEAVMKVEVFSESVAWHEGSADQLEERKKSMSDWQNRAAQLRAEILRRMSTNN